MASLIINGIKFVRVSRDFKIEEATRGMAVCQSHLDDPDDLDLDWAGYYRDWQAIAISWASA